MGQDTSSSTSSAQTSHREEKMKKGKCKIIVESSSSSSSSEEDEEGDKDNDQEQEPSSSGDEEVKMLIKRLEKTMKKLNSKGIPIGVEDIQFNKMRKEQRKNGCLDVEKWGTIGTHVHTLSRRKIKRVNANSRRRKNKRGRIKLT